MKASKRHRTGSSRTALGIVLLTAMLIASVAASSAYAADQGRYGGIIKVALYDEPATMDPHATTHPAARIVRQHIYETLIAWGHDFEFVPQLADSWEVSDDGLTYTFHLRKGVLFHHGREMVADDVIYSFERILEMSPRAGDYRMIDSMKALDDYTVQFTLKHVAPDFLAAVSMYFAHIVPKDHTEEQMARYGAIVEPVGTGPYRFVEWREGQHVRLARFDGFVPRDEEPNGLGGRKIAYLDEIIFQGVTEGSVRVFGIETGTFDYIMHVPPADVPLLEANPDVNMVAIPGTDWGILYFNFTRPPFNDIRMRKAVAHAIDYQELADAVFWGMGTANNSFIPESQGVWRTPEHERIHEYNPDLSRQLMREAGYNGEELFWPTRGDYTSVMAAQNIQAQLQAVGFNITLQHMEPAAFLDYVYARSRNEIPDWTMIATTRSGFRPDPHHHYNQRVHSSSHAGMYHNPEFDEIVDRAGSITDFEERKRLYARAQEIIMEDVPVIVLYNGPFLEAYRKELKNVYMRDPHSPFFWNVWLE